MWLWNWGSVSSKIVCLIAGCLVCFGVSGRGQNAPPDRQNNRVRLVFGSNPDFDQLIERFMPALYSSDQYPQIKASSIIIENNVHAVINALAVKWTIHRGTTSATHFSVWFPEQDATDLSERNPVLPTGGFALVSPIAIEIHRPNDTDEQSGETILAAYQNKLTSDALSSVVALEGTLDGVVFGNEIFMGHDAYGLAGQYVTERTADLDEVHHAESVIRSGGSIEQALLDDIRMHSQDKNDPVLVARLRAAMRLLSYLHHNGREALAAQLAKRAGKAGPQLHTLNGRPIARSAGDALTTKSVAKAANHE